jgi:succinyl-diaminopimelate desuccinylase
VTSLADVLDLVKIASVSRSEQPIADFVGSRLSANAALEITRIGDNIVARSNGTRAGRILIAGHLDTVPGDPTLARIEGDALHGVGACDMKATVAIMLDLALESASWASETTWVFYAREEIARSESGLLEIAASAPDLLSADVAVLGEPTNGAVEAGCQGTLRVALTMRGTRAHTARPFTGRNAIHRLAPVLALIAAYEPRVVTCDGVTYVEQLQAVGVGGGVSGNVVPDEVTLTLNHRFAPDRTGEQAYAWLQSLLSDLLEDGDGLVVEDMAPSAAPALSLGALSTLVGLTGHDARGKVGWTDVATLQSFGVPATNFGAGDPLLAHRSDECVTSAQLAATEGVLRQWLAIHHF